MNLQENIQRIKEVMGINEIIDDINGVPLFHHTTESRALSIMDNNELRGSLPDNDLIDLDQTLKNTHTQRMVSFSRDKNFIPDASIGASLGGINPNKINVIFVVDKDKLKTNYRVVPFDYNIIDDRNMKRREKEEPDVIFQPRPIRSGKNKEYEERVLTDKIFPLRKYLINIIYKGNNTEVQSRINQYLNK